MSFVDGGHPWYSCYPSPTLVILRHRTRDTLTMDTTGPQWPWSPSDTVSTLSLETPPLWIGSRTIDISFGTPTKPLTHRHTHYSLVMRPSSTVTVPLGTDHSVIVFDLHSSSLILRRRRSEHNRKILEDYNHGFSLGQPFNLRKHIKVEGIWFHLISSYLNLDSLHHISSRVSKKQGKKVGNLQ